MDSFAREPVFFAYKTADSVIVQVKGYADYLSAPVLKGFLSDISVRNCNRFCFLFDECDGIDSTCLGLLAGLALRLKKLGGICLFCGLKARQLECIQMVGLDRLVYVIESTPVALTQTETTSVAVEPEEARLTSQLVLEAHKFLMELNAKNKIKFQTVVSLLERFDR